MTSRRETLLRPPQDTHSSIPVPSSTRNMPPPSSTNNHKASMRQSLAPGRAPLQPAAVNLVSSNPRQSIYQPNGNNPLLMSTRKGGPGLGLTPARGQNRLSLWGGGVGAPIPGVTQPLKDTRPLREKAFQAQIARVISNYLANTDCPVQLSHKIHTATPTSQQYWVVVDWLVHQLDPCYPDPKQGQGAFSVGPNEFINVLKQLRYPFADGIDKKSLSTVGGMHSWPAMLAALHFLVSLCMSRTNYTSREDDPTLQNLEHVPEQFSGEDHSWTLAFHYYASAYTTFLEGHDQFPEERGRLEDRYSKKDEKILADLDGMRARHEQLRAEIAKISQTPAPVLKLREEHKRVLKDQEKFIVWGQHSEKRIQKYRDELARELQETEADENKLEGLQQEQVVLEEQVLKQNLSQDEVLRMNAEDASLDRMLSDLKVKGRDAAKTSLNLEVLAANRMDAVEQAIEEYMTLVYRLGLHPKPPPELGDLSFALELNGSASDPRQLVLGADIRTQIKPALTAFCELKRKERGLRDDERVRLENELDQVTMACENLEQEVAALETRIRVVNNEAEDMRDNTQREMLASNAEVNRLETELAQARAAAMSSGVGIGAKLQATQIAYQEQQEKVERLREETVRMVIKNTGDICGFKEQISDYLSHLRQMAEDS